MQLLYWMIGGEIDVLIGLPGMMLAFGLGWISMRPPTPQTPYYVFFALAGTLIVFPILRKVIHVAEGRSIDVDAIESSYEQLSLRINNPSSRFRIAKHLHVLGFYGHAIAIGERVLPELPFQFFRDEHRMVGQWKAGRPSPASFNPIDCVRCGFSNPPGEVHCTRCGGPFLLDRVKGRFFGESLGRKMLIGWSAGVYLLIVFAIWPAIPSPYNALLGVASTFVVAGVSFLLFKPEKQAT